MYDASRTSGQILAMLADTPARLTALAASLPPAQLTAPPASGEWSARDVLAHLRACGDVWGRYIVQILDQDRPAFKAVSPRTWIRKTDYLQQEFEPSLQAFAAQRAGLVAILEPLAPAAWSRAATVTGAGKPRQRTVYTYAEWLANHEQSHLKQIDRIVARFS